MAAVLYGIAHDGITAQICVEYFTFGHPDIFGTDSPTLLGVGWGIIATWWVGFLLGVLLAFAARFGKRPKVAPRALVRPIGRLLLGMAGFSSLAGLMGLIATRLHWVSLGGELTAIVPASKQAGFLVALWMHSMSYGVGLLGGLFLTFKTWQGRALSQDAA